MIKYFSFYLEGEKCPSWNEDVDCIYGLLEGYGKDIKGLEKSCYDSVEEAKKEAAAEKNETVTHEKSELKVMYILYSPGKPSKIPIRDILSILEL